MEKRRKIVLIVILMSLLALLEIIACTQLGLWNFSTGKVIEAQVPCSDSDGFNIYSPGYVTLFNSTLNDTCIDPGSWYVNEYTCSEDGTSRVVSKQDCPYGCYMGPKGKAGYMGACIDPNNLPSGFADCIDNEQGIDLYTKGSLTTTKFFPSAGGLPSTYGPATVYDSCSGNYVVDYFCNKSFADKIGGGIFGTNAMRFYFVDIKSAICLNGCSDGACIKPYPITSCQSINQSGIYSLEANLTVSENTCLYIFADNVTIEGNGFTITGINNCKNNLASNGCVGISTYSSRNVNINKVYFNDLVYGVYFYNSSYSQLSNSSITRCNLTGLMMSSSDNNKIENNVITFNGAGLATGGIYVGGLSNFFSKNVVANNYLGILIDANDNTFQNNNVVNNAYTDFSCMSSTITGNASSNQFDNRYDCAWLDSGKIPFSICNDPDGLNYFVKSSASDSKGNSLTDNCSTSTKLLEAICNGSKVASSAYTCLNGCSGGECLSKCNGTAPTTVTGMIKGSNLYGSNWTSKVWAYDATASSSTPCLWRCNTPTYGPYGSPYNTCVTQKTCSGTAPSGSGVNKGVGNYYAPTQNKAWTYVTNSSLNICQWTCLPNYIKGSGSYCLSTPIRNCSGIKPIGMGVVLGNLTYQSNSTMSWTYSSTMALNASCKWKCQTGYIQNGTTGCKK